MTGNAMSMSIALVGAASLLAGSAAAVTNTVIAGADVWVADSTPDANFEGSVNPSTQLRNDGTVRRVSFYRFEIPPLGVNQELVGVGFDINDFFGPSDFVADFGLLASNPDLSTITYNTAIADGFLQAGNDANQNPVVGANMALAGEAWDHPPTAAEGDELLFESTGGLVSLLKGVLDNSTTTNIITLALVPRDPVASATGAGFYGVENSEGGGFFPRPRLHLDVASPLVITTNLVADVFGFEFLTNPGQTYRLESTPDLVSSNFAPTGVSIEGTGSTLQLFDPTGFSSNKHYRVLEF